MTRRASWAAPIDRQTTQGAAVGRARTVLKLTGVERMEASKRALADPAVRRRMSEARKRALADPAVRRRMSEASKRALADPAVRRRMSEASKRAWADPAVRRRMSEARKRAWAEIREALAQYRNRAASE